MDIREPPINFLALAASMGVPARRISKADEVGDAVTEAIACRKPRLVEIVIGTE